MLALSSCVPDFSLEKKLSKQIRTETATLEWTQYVGILDQNFPDLVILSYGNNNDTICRAFNIADVNIFRDKITIGFYGKPDVRGTLPSKSGHYTVIADTTYAMETDAEEK